MREGLIAVKTQELSQQNGGYKLEQLMGYLNGPDFRNRMNAVCDAVRKLEEIQQRERKVHDKTWNEQAVLYKTVTGSCSEIDNEIRAIMLGR